MYKRSLQQLFGCGKKMIKCEEHNCPLKEHYNDITCEWDFASDKCFGYVKEIMLMYGDLVELQSKLREHKREAERWVYEI